MEAGVGAWVFLSLSVLNVCLGIGCCALTGVGGLVCAGNDACMHT